MAKKKEENKNLELWNQVCETNPAITKHVNTRGGFTAIDAQSQVKRATELFGPFGMSWGLDDLVYTMIGDGNNQPVGISLTAKFFYGYGEKSGAFPIAADMVYKPNDDCFKKLRTECISKALSTIGFNSDVFEGKFDDNKYVAEMNSKYKSSEKPKEKPVAKEDVPVKDMDTKLLQKIAETMARDLPDGYIIDLQTLKDEILAEFGKYPTKESSIPKVLEKISVKAVMIENDFVKGLE